MLKLISYVDKQWKKMDLGLFVQQNTPTNDKIVLSYLDLIMWVCNVVY